MCSVDARVHPESDALILRRSCTFCRRFISSSAEWLIKSISAVLVKLVDTIQ